MMTSPLIIQGCCINLTAEYPHFSLGHHSLILMGSSTFPLSLPHKFHHIPQKKMVLHSWLQRQNALAVPSRSRPGWEWASAGCHWHSRQPRGSAAAQQPQRPPERTLPEASQYCLQGGQFQHPLGLSSPCPAFLLFRKVVYLFALHFISLL